MLTRTSALMLQATLSASMSAQTVHWMHQGGIGGQGRGISSDAGGRCYVAGVVNDPAVFDGISTTSHFADVFIARYDEAGAIQWVRTAGDVLIDQANAITTDAEGNSYVTGFFTTNGAHPTVSFGGTILQGLGSSDLFLAKYDAAGELLWVRHGGGILAEEGRGVAISADGNVVVSGFFQGTAVFAGETLSSEGLSDILLLKYDPAGNLLWSARAGGSGEDEANKLTACSNGDIAIAGSFQASFDLGGNTLTCSGLSDILLARFDAAGTALWSAGAGSAVSFAADQAFDIEEAANGDLVFCGEIAGPADLGGIELVPHGGIDLFLARHDAEGNVIWARHAGGPQVDHAYGVSLDADGNTYLTGQADDGANTVFDTIILEPFGNEAVFLAKYDADGDVHWVKRYAPGLGGDAHVLNDGCLYFTGAASGIVGQPAFDEVPWQYVDRAIFTARFCTDLSTDIPGARTNEPDTQLLLYPNPSSGGAIHVEAGMPLHSIDLLDGTGKLIARYSGALRSIPAPVLAGSYLVRAVHSDGRRSLARLICF